MNTIDSKTQPLADPAAEQKPSGRVSLKRLAPLAILAVGFGLFFAFDLDRFVTFQALHDNRMALMDFVDQRGVLATALFVLVYVVSTALSLPGGAVLTITGGFLFGSWLGTLYVVVGATAGAIAVFLIARRPWAMRFAPRLARHSRRWRPGSRRTR